MVIQPTFFLELHSERLKNSPVLPHKRFHVINEGFMCEQCDCEVLPTSGGTPRNHCPFCLCSKHVDINPGDRANPCRGLMKPIGVTTDGKRIYLIHHRCVQCGETHPTRAILHDDQQRDNFDLITDLSAQPFVKTLPSR